MTHLNPRVARVVAGLAAVSALAVVPMAAQAATTDATGTLNAGTLLATAPAITPFSTMLTGVVQSPTTDVGAWSVTDATETGAGYNVTVAAGAATVDADLARAGTGGSISMDQMPIAAATGNTTATGPVPVGGAAQNLSAGAATIYSAAAGTGQGKWDVASGLDNLTVVIPADAQSGAYSSTLTFTTAPLT